jgi:hypothetical protein
VLWRKQLIVFGGPESGTMGSLRYRAWHEGFFGRKLSIWTPTTAMLASVVTLLGVSLWIASPHKASGENR